MLPFEDRRYLAYMAGCNNPSDVPKKLRIFVLEPNSPTLLPAFDFDSSPPLLDAPY